jgi:uncharacterized membrane protein YdjX (TVP38/TMEM64 family)
VDPAHFPPAGDVSHGRRSRRSLRDLAWRHRGRVVVIAVFAIGLGAFFALGGPHWLSLDALKHNRAELIAFADDHRVGAVMLAMAIYTAVIGLSVPGALWLTLACGLVFGRWIGTAIALVGATAGATIVFVAARYLFAEAAHRRLGERGRRIAAGFAEHAWSYMLFLRLVPLFPFVLINLASALAPIPLSTYVLATAIGIVPGTFIYVNLGQAVGRIDSIEGLVSPEVLLALALLGLLALTPIVVAKVRARRLQG